MKDEPLRVVANRRMCFWGESTGSQVTSHKAFHLESKEAGRNKYKGSKESCLWHGIDLFLLFLNEHEP